MRPYNLFTNVNVFGDNGAVHYNSLQAEVQKRMGSFMFNSNFTWSKNMYNWANTETETWDWPKRGRKYVGALAYGLMTGFGVAL